MRSTSPVDTLYAPRTRGPDVIACSGVMQCRVCTAWAKQSFSGGLMHVDDVGRLLTRSFATMLDHPGIDTRDPTLDARTGAP